MCRQCYTGQMNSDPLLFMASEVKTNLCTSSVTIKPPFLFLGFHSCQEQQALYTQHAAADSLNTQQNLLRDESIT